MRLAATVCAVLLLSACASHDAPRAHGGSETFATAAEQPARASAGDSVPLWARGGDLRIPGWEVKVTQIDAQRFHLDLRMRTLINGGDGEARTAFLRSAREIVDSGGYAGYDVLRYEERIDAGLFFARRGAHGEIRVVESHTWGM